MKIIYIIVVVRGQSICSSCSRLWESSAEGQAESRSLQVCVCVCARMKGERQSECVFVWCHLLLFVCRSSLPRCFKTRWATSRTPMSPSPTSTKMSSTPSSEMWVKWYLLQGTRWLHCFLTDWCDCLCLDNIKRHRNEVGNMDDNLYLWTNICLKAGLLWRHLAVGFPQHVEATFWQPRMLPVTDGQPRARKPSARMHKQQLKMIQSAERRQLVLCMFGLTVYVFNWICWRCGE